MKTNFKGVIYKNSDFETVKDGYVLVYNEESGKKDRRIDLENGILYILYDPITIGYDIFIKDRKVYNVESIDSKFMDIFVKNFKEINAFKVPYFNGNCNECDYSSGDGDDGNNDHIYNKDHEGVNNENKLEKIKTVIEFLYYNSSLDCGLGTSISSETEEEFYNAYMKSIKEMFDVDEYVNLTKEEKEEPLFSKIHCI